MVLSTSGFVQEIPGKPCKHHFPRAWRSEQNHYQIPHCLLSNKHLLWWSPALSSHGSFTAHGAVAVTAFHLQSTLTYLLSHDLSGSYFLEKGQISFSVAVRFGARNNRCKNVLLSCWLTPVLLFPTAHREPCWTEYRTRGLASYSFLMTVLRT